MAKLTWYWDIDRKQVIGMNTPPKIYTAFCIGDKPTKAFFNGEWMPIDQLNQRPNVVFYTLNRTKVQGFTTFADRKTYLTIARMYEPKFTFLTNIK